MTQFNEPRFGVDDVPMNTRTSVMAVISLVCGLASLVGCCLMGVAPSVGILGGILGGLALYRISASNGRLGGSGLAIGGIVTSLLGLALGIVLVFGASQLTNSFGKYGAAVEIAQSQDQSGLNALLTTKAANQATPEGLADFRAKTLASLGKYKRERPGLITFLLNMSSVEQAAKALPPGTRQQEVPIPVPVEFEKGPASMFVQLEQNNPNGVNAATTPFGLLENIGVYDPGTGKVYWLIDPASTAAPSLPTTTPASPAAPATGSAPSEDPAHSPNNAPATPPEKQPEPASPNSPK